MGEVPGWGAEEPITADDAVHPDVVVKEIARLGARNFVDVLASGNSFDIDHFCPCKPLPVQTFLFEVACEALVELGKELDRVRGHVNVFSQEDNRSR